MHCLQCLGIALGQPLTPLRLSIQPLANRSVRVTWPNSAAGFVLEEASAANSTLWQAVAQTPVLTDGQLSVSLDASTGNKFFRLHAQLTSVRATSPVNGETGVAVTRETIVHFSAPLSTNTVIGRDGFYAGFGGRRVLSRVELSSDRTKATLFYLEPLPGSARVVAVLDGNALLDEAGVALDADGDGVPGGQAIIAFVTLNLTSLAGTAVMGRVFASELVPGSDTGTNAVNQPLAGVTITVDGMEQSLRTVTDATGSFTLSPVPPGRFFVHIDGRTVTNVTVGIHYPDKSYYPYVGKAWEAVAGVTNNPAGGTGTIFLPLIVQGTLQSVSMTTDTTISFPPSVVSSNPALAGVSITVPANSLFADDGTRGGKVGIAAVPPDRLPGPLPPGAEMPLVITVQTDGGLNFDKPVPICFPNLPNPTTGKPWPPGTKGSLISFNHKKGVWEDVGDMTVSADGKFFCTDPGVGILQPGWHGPQCPKATKSPPPPKPPPPCRFRPDAFEGCLGTCLEDFEVCLERAGGRLSLDHLACKSVVGGRAGFVCVLRARQFYLARVAICGLNSTICDEICAKRFTCIQKPSSPSNAESSNQLQNAVVGAMLSLEAAPGSDPVGDRLAAIFNQISDLIGTLDPADPAIPPGVQNEIDNLLAQADAVAGGDSSAYLRSKIIAGEERSAAKARQIGLEPEDLNPGNAPHYPVLYAATVLRPGGLFTIRSQTEPFGQYTLFLPPDGTLLDVSFYDPKTKQFGSITPNLSPNARYPLPRFSLVPLASDEEDFDKDGLPNLVEDVYGTDPNKADTDGDGIPDGAEIDQGTDPLGGLVAQTGIIATVKTPGAAVDIWTGNDLAILAEGASGVSVVNISTIRQPTIIAHIDTPGQAQRVAASGNFVAVADGGAGLAVIDITDPVTARIIHQVNLPGAQAITASAGLAYVGLSSGRVVAVSLTDGTILNQVNVTNAVQDLGLAGDYLYALTGDRLFVISLVDGVLSVAGSAASPFRAALNQRLFVGGGIAYTAHRNGYNTLDVTNPVKPVLLIAGNTAQFGWRQIVANGSGLGLAAVGPNSPDAAPRDVSLYDLSDPRATDVVIIAFPTPGNARAVSIFNGLAYVADDTAGLQVVNYLPYDAKGVPPTIALTTSFPANGAEEGRLARVTAQVGDDVQVRNVEFYLDGAKVFTDAAFPFEFRFVTPRLAADQKSFRLRARAFDTGGNFTWAEEMVVTLLADTTPPRVTHYSPLSGGKALRTVSAYFDGPMDSATLNVGSFKLVLAGADGVLGTADDLPVSGGSVSYQADLQAASLSFAAPLPDGHYRAVLTTAVADLAGNRLVSDFTWQFRVADAVFWIKTTDGLWNDPLNWSTGAVPGPNDNVVIDIFSVDVRVTHASGTIQMRNLIANERLQINGGVLQVSGLIELSQQPLTLNGGTIRGGTVTQSNGAKMIFASNGGNTFDGVSVVGDLDLTTPNARLLIRNGLTLAGAVRVDKISAIGFTGVQTFDNASIVFGNGSGFLSVEGNSTLTLGPNAVVRGKNGVIGQPIFAGGSNKIINQGLISAEVAGGTLIIKPTVFENTGTVEAKNGGSATILSGTWSNSSLMTATTGGALTLDGSFTNTGTIQVDNATVNLDSDFTLPILGRFQRTGGTVNVRSVLDLKGGTLALDATTGSWTLSGGTIRSGTVTQNGGAKMIFASNGGNTFDGVSVVGDLDLTTPNARLLIRNGLTLAGAVRVDQISAIGFTGVQTFDNASIVFGNGSGFLSVEGNSTLTLGPNAVVRGKNGVIGQPIFGGGANKLINQGLISADVAGGTLTIKPTVFENSGTIAATASGSTLKVQSTSFTNTGTTQELNGGKVVTP